MKCKNKPCSNDAVLNGWDNQPTFGGECRPCAFNLTGIEVECTVCTEITDTRYIRETWGSHSNICNTCVKDIISDLREYN
jgi:hypothetical protein